MNAGRWLLAALSLASAEAAADCPKCECISYLGLLPAKVEPHDVALNARVRTGYVPDAAKKERFVLRAVDGAPVEVTTEKLHEGTYDTLVLTPTAPLAKNTAYELVLLRGANTVPYSKFTTSDATDTTAPTWTGELSAELVPADPCSVECNARRGPRVEITAPVPSDDRSGADVVDVWLTTGAAIDYTKPATGHVVVARNEGGGFGGLGGLGAAESPHVTIVVGGAGPCTKQSIALPRGAKRVRIGMKVLDRAGNASAPREVEVRLVTSKKPPH